MLFRCFLTMPAAMWRVRFIIPMGRTLTTTYTEPRMVESNCTREILTKGFSSTRQARLFEGSSILYECCID